MKFEARQNEMLHRLLTAKKRWKFLAIVQAQVLWSLLVAYSMPTILPLLLG